MELELLTAPAEKKLDLTEITGKEGEFVTLRLWPIEERTKIELARTNGMKAEGLMEIISAHPEVDFSDRLQVAELLKNNPDLLIKFTRNPDFDGGYKFMLLALEYGVDPSRHSFMTKGKPAELTRKVWDKMLHSGDGGKVCRYIVAEVEEFQKAYSLGN